MTEGKIGCSTNYHTHRQPLVSATTRPAAGATPWPAQGCPSCPQRTLLQRFNVDPKRLTSPNEHGLEARNVAMWIVSELCGLKLQAIGELFGGLDYAAVAQRIRRTRLKYPEKEATDLIREMSNV